MGQNSINNVIIALLNTEKFFFSSLFSKALMGIVAMLSSIPNNAQTNYWQQHVIYRMDVQLNVATNIITGKQNIVYTNNSPDTLKKLFFSLYYNAFQPNSMMDVHSRSTEFLVIGHDAKGKDVTDFDSRFKYRIPNMTPAEQGYCHITSLSVAGKSQKFKEQETVLEVVLDKPILPKQTVTLNTEFQSQVPRLSRRSGRDSQEGVRYSLGQWYPKLNEYDNEGWHPDDYVAREFYGPWGDFEVNITLDKNYKIGASGVLQNAAEIGWGYDKEGSPLKPIAGNTRTWNFKAENVHDFAWVADPEYIHFTRRVNKGLLLHFIYKFTDSLQQKKWHDIADSTVLAYPYMAKTFGDYPYPVYSFLHGGGGGTEYPMATMLRGAGLDGAIHEWMHSWYQMMLGTNENLYAWMDEGFTSYADARVQAHLKNDIGFFYKDEYDRYFRLAKSQFAEPMSTHANFFATNMAYNSNSYNKGAVFVEQLGYITGADTRDKILLEYYRQWRFKHPTPANFMKVAEEVSGLELKWYKDFWVNTIKTIDYKIDSLWSHGYSTFVRSKRLGDIPMPLDVQLTFKDGAKEMHYVPLNMMYGNKPAEDATPRIIYKPQPWTDREIIIATQKRINDITVVEIDPSLRMADVDRKNNKLELKW
ncbi:M1 family metallopeptidase [soil metagenome]